jgi:hypothetical protein
MLDFMMQRISTRLVMTACQWSVASALLFERSDQTQNGLTRLCPYARVLAKMNNEKYVSVFFCLGSQTSPAFLIQDIDDSDTSLGGDFFDQGCFHHLRLMADGSIHEEECSR